MTKVERREANHKQKQHQQRSIILRSKKNRCRAINRQCFLTLLTISVTLLTFTTIMTQASDVEGSIVAVKVDSGEQKLAKEGASNSPAVSIDSVAPVENSPGSVSIEPVSGHHQPATAEQQQKRVVELLKKVESAPSEPQLEQKSDPKALESAEKSSVESHAQSARKSRADTNESKVSDSSKQGSQAAAAEKAPAASKAAEQAATTTTKAPPSKAGSKSTQTSQPQKSSSNGSKSKLPANLGTVTSTGSGGHYLSKHDAYSAIAEKHGALAHDAMRKSDKRQLQASHSGGGSAGPFGGIKKASGGLVGDLFGPFKGVTDSGLARTLGASMRSIMKSKYSAPAYVASALLGAVAMMAFFESPISPLPVPSLPGPPNGRFPPEMPNLPVGTQVPFRGAQLQQYLNSNQRSGGNLQVNYNGGAQIGSASQQQPQQVLFPGSMTNAQQRQMPPGPSPTQAVANLAGNLISSAKQQVAQRKSSPDYDLLSSSRSFFGSASHNSGNSYSGPSKAQQANKKQGGGSFLSYIGLGGGSGSSSPAGELQGSASAQQLNGLNQLQNAANSPSSSAMNAFLEPKGAQFGQLSNSHVVNKVKSYFNRSPANSVGSSSSSYNVASANSNPYDQYQKMSLVQALIKDTAFIPGFLAPTRKSSQASTSTSASSSSSSASAVPVPANSRMQVDGPSGQSVGGLPKLRSSQQQQTGGSSSGGYGLVKAADRIAHALLETFTSNIAQRANSGSQHSNQEVAARKSSSNDDSSSLASATTSLLSDIMSSYSSNAQNNEQNSPQPEQQVSSGSIKSNPVPQQQQSQVSTGQQQQQQHQQASQPADTQSASGRSSDDEQQKQQLSASPAVSLSSPSVNSKSSSTAAAAPADSNTHVRKTRSIGFEYPLEIREQPPQPSKAAKINNIIDFVADSYTQNRLLFNFVMNQVGLSQAVPYVEQILASSNEIHH